MTKNLTRDVFTPTISAKLTFVERDEINDQLVDAITQPGKQVVIYGHSGSGKTTLLVNKLNQLYENYVISRCTEATTIEQLILDAFDQLDKYYTSEVATKTGWKIGLDIGASYNEIKGLLKGEYSSESSLKMQRVLPPQLTEQRLARFLGAAKCCWVLEDFHKVKTEHRRFVSQKMKLFKDTADEYPDVKIIAIGAVGSAREVIENDKEMNTRVEEIYVPLMNRNQLLEVIIKGEELLRIVIPAAVKNRIIDLSNGLGAVCHQLCLNMCMQNNIIQTQETPHIFSKEDLDRAVTKYINGQSETFKGAFENGIKIERAGGKYENGKIILKVLSSETTESLTHAEILIKIHEVDPTYPASNLTIYLKRLATAEKDEILRFDEKSGKYSFSNPFVKVYARMYLEEQQNNILGSTINVGNSNISIVNSKNVVTGSHISVGGDFKVGDG